MAMLNYCTYKKYLNTLFNYSNHLKNSSCFLFYSRLSRLLKSYLFNSNVNSNRLQISNHLKYKKLYHVNSRCVICNKNNSKHGTVISNYRFFHCGSNSMFPKIDNGNSNTATSLISKDNHILKSVDVPVASSNDWISQKYNDSRSLFNDYSSSFKNWTKSRYKKYETNKSKIENTKQNPQMNTLKQDTVTDVNESNFSNPPSGNAGDILTKSQLDEIPGNVRAYFSDSNLKELNLMYEEKLNVMTDKKPNILHKQTASALLTKPLENLRLWFPTLNVRQQVTSALRKDTVDAKKPNEDANRKVIVRSKNINRKELEQRTKGIALNVINSTTSSSLKNRLDILCAHLREFPQAKGIANKESIKNNLLWRREINHDTELLPLITKALVLLGHVNPVSHRGIRVLTIDGGGTRGLLSIVMLRELEKICDAPIHELFDFICGVSTGGLIAALLSAYKKDLGEIEEIYRKFSVEMFQRGRLRGAGNLLFTHSYYNTELWEGILKNQIGMKTFLEVASDSKCPKLAILSTIMNQPQMQNFVFRNYAFPPGVYSHYAGSIHHQIWEGIRASSAAPGYYAEFKLGDYIHSDGGILTNNPTAVAMHEAKLLWPNENIQCIVSLGTGRFRPIDVRYQESPSLSNKVYKIIQSATDTEAIHTIMSDLAPRSSYFRFNPYMSEDFQLDEIRPDKWKSMEDDTVMYCRKNINKFKNVATKLQERRLLHQIMRDNIHLNSTIKSN